MRNQVLEFLRSESGATTVDWVVLAAATVGIGVGAAQTVRSGVASLGGDINTALGGAEVTLLCQGGSGDYAMQIFTGDRAEQGTSIANELSRMSDAELASVYAETAEKAQVLHDGGEPADYVAEIVDYSYLMNAELQRRGLNTPEGSAAFNDLYAGISGQQLGCGALGGAGAGDGAAQGNGSTYDMQLYSDEERNLIERELLFASDEDLATMLREVDQAFDEALQNRDEIGMQKALDHFYLARAEVLSRARDSETMAAADEMWDRRYTEYLAYTS